MTGLTRALARFIVNSECESLPPAIRHVGGREFVNRVGCACGGSHEAGVEKALAVLTEFNGAAFSTVVGRREKRDALNAAFINSMASAALAYSETYTSCALSSPPTPNESSPNGGRSSNIRSSIRSPGCAA